MLLGALFDRAALAVLANDRAGIALLAEAETAVRPARACIALFRATTLMAIVFSFEGLVPVLLEPVSLVQSLNGYLGLRPVASSVRGVVGCKKEGIQSARNPKNGGPS